MMSRRMNSTMKNPLRTAAARALRSIPAGSFLRYNAADELEVVARDGRPLAADQQQRFLAQLPEVTLANLKVGLLHCS